MNFKYVINSKILFYIFLLVSEISFGKECSFDGINCISCTEYQNCDTGFPDERVISCTFGDSCADDQLKQCQMKLNCYALNECAQAGIFPDVMVDSNYYVCLNDASSGFLKYEFTCPEGNFFDKVSLSCIPREVTLGTTEVPGSSVTTDPISPSISTDPTSPLSTDPTSPLSTDPTSPLSTDPTSPLSTDPTSPLSTDPTSPISTDPTSPTPITSTSSTSTSSTTPTPSTSAPIPSPTTTPFACAASGIFPDPFNCKMYYRCSTSLKVFVYICPGNSYFNENILKCSMIITPSCQEQILKNSTSTVTPTTPVTTITTASTTPKPITTTSTSTVTPTTPATIITKVTTTSTSIATTTTTTTTPATTTTTSTIAPFSCPMSGTFADPLSCKTYFRCTSSGKKYQYVCPGNTYFNEFTKRCSLIMTPRCRSLIQAG